MNRFWCVPCAKMVNLNHEHIQKESILQNESIQQLLILSIGILFLWAIGLINNLGAIAFAITLFAGAIFLTALALTAKATKKVKENGS